MLILLDAKDLIDLVDHEKPLSLAAAANLFRERGWSFVLTTTNVVEFAAGATKQFDRLQTRRRIQQIEELPVRYMRSAWIEQHEVEAAYRAFKSGLAVDRIEPFVHRWDETIVGSGRPPNSAMLVNLRLDEMVTELAASGRLDLARYAAIAQLAAQDDRRNRSLTRVSDKTRYTRLLEMRMQMFAFGPGTAAERRSFADWLAAHPLNCPASWFHYRVHEEFIRNSQDSPKRGDMTDFSHIPCVPYVNAATFDRRMLAYARAAAKSLARLDSTADYRSRLFHSLAEIIAGG